MKTDKLKTVGDYVNAQPKKTQEAFIALKKCILKVKPNATELFNYNSPAYALVEAGKRNSKL